MNVLDSLNTIQFVIKPTLLLLVLLLVQLLCRRTSAATRHATLVLGLIALTLLPLLTLSLPDLNLRVLPPDPPAPAAVDAYPTAPADLRAGVPLMALQPLARSQAEPALPTLTTNSAQSSGWKSRLAGASAGERTIALWLVGVVLVLGRVAAGLLRMRWIVRRGHAVDDRELNRLLKSCADRLDVRRLPRVILSERVGVPVVWGWRKPVLIVPVVSSHWKEERMRVVLLHELAHLRRADWPLLLLGRIVASLYWFHPLVWYLERRAKRECEQACDDLVVQAGTKPSDYAGHLIAIARGVTAEPSRSGTALAIVRRSQLNGRVRSILNPGRRRDEPSRGRLTLVAAALLIALLPFASLQLATRAYAADKVADLEPVFESGSLVELVPVAEPPVQEVLLAQNVRHKERYEVQRQLREPEAFGDDGDGWFQKAYALHYKGAYDEAIEAFEQAVALDYRPATSTYNIACGHALLGDLGSAMSSLDKARELGFDGLAQSLVRDSDFDSLRASEAFQDYIDAAFEAEGRVRRGAGDHPYQTAMDALQELRDTGSTDYQAWHSVGTQLLSMRELDTAIDALSEAVKHRGDHGQNSLYNLACAYSLAGDARSALEAGFDQHERFLNDADLNNLRNDPAFDRLSEKSELLSLGQFPGRNWEDSNYSEARWAPAIALYRNYVAENPASGRGWFNLGYALHYSRQFAEAIEADARAAQLGFRPATSAYNTACSQAMLNQTDAAVNSLRQAIELGFTSYGHLESDEDLESLRGDPRFEALLDEIEEKTLQQRYEHEKHKMKLRRIERIESRRHDDGAR